VFLYRVVGPLRRDGVLLEDCYGLDLVRVTASELHARRLRVVDPEPAAVEATSR